MSNKDNAGHEQQNTPSTEAQLSPSSISFPNGGPAIGTSQKSPVDRVIGIDSMRMAAPISSERTGLGPQFSRSYDSEACSRTVRFTLAAVYFFILPSTDNVETGLRKI